MTGCRKPGFFTERNLLFAVNGQDSRLSNTDNGAPILPIDQADLPSSMPATSSPQMEGVVRLRRILRAALRAKLTIACSGWQGLT